MLIRWRDSGNFPNLSSMFDDFFRSDVSHFFGQDMNNFPEGNMSMPAVNVREKQDCFMIDVAAPGLSKEDFRLDIDHNVLTVSAQKETRSGYDQPQNQAQPEEQKADSGKQAKGKDKETETEGKAATQHQPQGETAAENQNQPQQNQMERFTRREFSYTSFQRSFMLPETVDPEKVAASYKDGILTINLPKREQQQNRRSRQINIS